MSEMDADKIKQLQEVRLWSLLKKMNEWDMGNGRLSACHGVCVCVCVCVQFQGKLAEYAQRGKTIQGRIRQAEYVRSQHESRGCCMRIAWNGVLTESVHVCL